MKGKTAEYSWHPVKQSNVSPCDRFKHACCVCRGFLYVYGGRRNMSLSDFWRFNIVSKVWERLESSKDGPEELEEHTMVDYQGILYIFGGMVDSVFTQKRNPLWMYDTDSTRWLAYQLTTVEGEGLAPVNRKGHSAVVYCGSMYVYGGYIDLKGASQEFWTFPFNTKQWTPVSAASSGGSPGSRHGHSAVVYGNSMYLFGGLVGLREQKDFWKWDFISASWSSIRRREGPSRAVGHSALIFEDSMLIFGGGISNSRPSGSFWKYHFPSQMWERLSSPVELSSKAYHHMLGIGYGFQGAADSPLRSLSSLSAEEKRCSRLLALSRHHTCFCGDFSKEPTYQIFSNEAGTEIEMKIFHQSSQELGFTSSQTTTGAELSSIPEADLLLKETSSLGFSKEEEFATMDLTAGGSGRGYVNPENGDICESSAVILLVGGKPLSGSSAITFWQLELNRT